MRFRLHPTVKKSFIYLVIEIELDNVPVVRQTEGLVVSTVTQTDASERKRVDYYR